MHQQRQISDHDRELSRVDGSETGGMLYTAVAATFGTFLFTSAFSIAAAQVSLGITIALFAILVIRGRFLPQEPSLRSLLIVWAAYASWLVLSSLVNDNSWRSLNCIREEWLLIILPVGLFLNRDRTISRRLMAGLAFALAIVSLYGAVQHFTGWRFPGSPGLHTAGGNFRLAGNFSHPLTYGYYVVTATIFFLTFFVSGFRSLSRRDRFLYGTTAFLGLAASALSNSRGPLLALLIGLVILGFLAGRLRWAMIALTLVGGAALVFSPGLAKVFAERVAGDWHLDNPAGRLFIWKQAAEIALDQPVFGCGPGNFGEAYSAQLSPEYANSGRKGHAHNDFIHEAAVGGFPAALLLAAFCGVAIHRFLKLRRLVGLGTREKALALAGMAATVTFLTGSMTECTFADEELRQLLMALWAFAWIPTAPSAPCMTLPKK